MRAQRIATHRLVPPPTGRPALYWELVHWASTQPPTPMPPVAGAARELPVVQARLTHQQGNWEDPPGQHARNGECQASSLPLAWQPLPSGSACLPTDAESQAPVCFGSPRPGFGSLPIESVPPAHARLRRRSPAIAHLRTLQCVPYRPRHPQDAPTVEIHKHLTATLLCNRSVCFLRMGNTWRALADAEGAMQAFVEWGLCHFRRGSAPFFPASLWHPSSRP